jgi:hypothetical protein
LKTALVISGVSGSSAMPQLIADSAASEIKASDTSARAFAALRLSMLGISLHLSPVRLAEADHQVRRGERADDRHLIILRQAQRLCSWSSELPWFPRFCDAVENDD